MIFEQFYLACLSHASYLVGDDATGRAVVVDPQRDIDGYLRAARSHGLRIERVIETHLHADFLSGHLELAAATGAVISYGVGAVVDYPIEPLRDGDTLALGEVRLDVLATPGHTPESICLVVRESPSAEPWGVLTGDTLFIGSVGRPDLLASAGTGLDADTLARRLYHSLRDNLLELPECTRVFPAHGAGSACGRKLSSESESTIGHERATNWALQEMDENAFVALVNEGQTVAPAYFSFDAQRNREDRPLLRDGHAPRALTLDEVRAAIDGGAVALDTREPADFAAGHLRGSINVGLQGRFAEWSGNVLAPDDRIVLVGDPAAAFEARVRLSRIGFDDIVGLLADPAELFLDHPELTASASRLTAAQLRSRRSQLADRLVLVDVRSPTEADEAGTIDGALSMPLPLVSSQMDSLDPDAPTVVFCASGYRSSTAASVLRSRGFTDASDLLGGYDAWAAEPSDARG